MGLQLSNQHQAQAIASHLSARTRSFHCPTFPPPCCKQYVTASYNGLPILKSRSERKNANPKVVDLQPSEEQLLDYRLCRPVKRKKGRRIRMNHPDIEACKPRIVTFPVW